MATSYFHTPIANMDAPDFINFFRNGYHRFERESYDWNPDFFPKLDSIRSNKDIFEIKPKNNGAKTLVNSVLESPDSAFIIDYLFETKLIQKCMEVVGTPLYLTNYTFIECDQKTRALPWHRDSYHYRGKGRVGNLPYSYKLVLTLDDLDGSSSGTEVMKGSHNIDFNSLIFDLFMRAFTPGKTRFQGKQGDAMIFNGHCLHRRPRTPGNKSRSTIIFGLSPVQWHQKNYLESHSQVIERYNYHFNKLLDQFQTHA